MRQIAGYTILAELGEGAASTIYAVQDPKTKRVWALKHVERRSEKDDRFIEQAITEHTVASRFDHPVLRRAGRIIKRRERRTVVELFLLLDLVDGVDLEVMGTRNLRSFVHIYRQVAEGLGHMHERGYVHADMKPSNVIVLDSGDARVIDFGQSCEIGTVKQRIQGTPQFIAPEQVRRDPLSPRTDVYNLGATMYRSLTKRHLPTVLDRDAVRSGRPPVAVPPHEITGNVPEDLSELVMRCVEHDAFRRPSGMPEVIEALDAVLDGRRAADETRCAVSVA
jgi:serine/threonine protein kinase